MLKIENVVKSNESKQVNNGLSVIGNTDTYVNMETATHNQYNAEVSMLNYTKYTKCQKYTINNIALYIPTDETLVKSTFEVIGEEPIFGHCITTQDLINIYANGCIQGFYEEYCKLHTDEENLILGKVLSILGIEVWRDVECYGGIYSGLYFVSNMSRVKRLYKNKHVKILKQEDNPCGYMYVTLSCKGKVQHVRVNRLVALTFIGESTDKLDACHSNTNTYDNRLFNLDLKTHWENLQNPLTQKKLKETYDSKAKAKAESKADKAESTTTESTTSAPTSTLE